MYISKQDLEKLGIKNVTPDVPETKHDSLQMQRNLEINMMVKGVQRQRIKIFTNAKSIKKDKDNKPRETT